MNMKKKKCSVQNCLWLLFCSRIPSRVHLLIFEKGTKRMKRRVRRGVEEASSDIEFHNRYKIERERKRKKEAGRENS